MPPRGRVGHVGRPRRVEVHLVVGCHGDGLSGRQLLVDLAERQRLVARDGSGSIRRIEHRELPVGVAARVVADVGDDDATVRQHATPVGVRVVLGGLVGGDQTQLLTLNSSKEIYEFLDTFVATDETKAEQYRIAIFDSENPASSSCLTGLPYIGEGNWDVGIVTEGFSFKVGYTLKVSSALDFE